MMFINNFDWSDAELQFGGVKNSGYGRELGSMGVQEFVHQKLLRTMHLDAPAIERRHARQCRRLWRLPSRPARWALRSCRGADPAIGLRRQRLPETSPDQCHPRTAAARAR